jgi:hypothetical protein
LKFIRRQDIVTDFTTFANLSERAAGGENVEADARDSVMKNLLSDNDYRVIVNASRETGWRKRGYSHIADNLKPSAFEKKVGNTATIRSANALRDWNQWVRDNPQATDAQADAESRRIVSRVQQPGAGSERGDPAPTDLPCLDRTKCVRPRDNLQAHEGGIRQQEDHAGRV